MSIGYINLKWAVIIKHYYKISSSIILQFVNQQIIIEGFTWTRRMVGFGNTSGVCSLEGEKDKQEGSFNDRIYGWCQNTGL